MALTALAIRNAQPKAKQYKLGDGHSLFLLVMPNGAKYWRFRYRFLDKQKVLAIGVWPEVSLADARAKRDSARRMIDDGVDPMVEKKRRKLRAQIDANVTFKGVAEEWFVKITREERADVTLSKVRWLLEKVYPFLGGLPLHEIEVQEVLAVLRKVEATGHYESARRMRSVISRVFRYGIATGRAKVDVARDLRGAIIVPKTKHFAAITRPKEVGELLRNIEDSAGSAITRFALRMTPHVFVRPGELRRAEWSEFDLERAVWSIPAEKMKMRWPHQVPLSRQVLDLLDEIRPLTGHSPYVFPALHTWKRPMSENTITFALRRMGYGGDQMTAHGFRAMAATLLNEMGLWNPDAIERQLAHMENNGVRRAYARGQYWEERVRMMQHWSDYLDQLRDGDGNDKSFGDGKVVTIDFGGRARRQNQ
ncbi:tyrosine-type recombinase/integrase [Sphingomonas kyeonggiensis]|uniref:Integrase n=1 Tax=Sphingomonas kyeonggiensis TaxID=1268553 RepID=A0A7W6JWB1_9SPHN|nr:integrase arm-type DNA-binding domain-containing protein [Sphingomonas kyeonggiensis]MBB4100721.1 integrase [Sphingomonas kyeonggiensis]